MTWLHLEVVLRRWMIHFPLLLAFASPGLAQDGSTASSLTIPPDATSLAMGGAYTAIAEGASSVWWNPGGLGFQHGVFVRPVTYGQLVPEFGSDFRFYSGGATGILHGIGLGLQYSELS